MGHYSHPSFFFESFPHLKRRNEVWIIWRIDFRAIDQGDLTADELIFVTIGKRTTRMLRFIRSINGLADLFLVVTIDSLNFEDRHGVVIIGQKDRNSGFDPIISNLLIR